MFSAVSFVCGCVGVFACQHDNFRTSEHRMMKFGGRCIAQKSLLSSNLGVIAPAGVRNPQNVAFYRAMTRNAKRKQSDAVRRNIASDASCA